MAAVPAQAVAIAVIGVTGSGKSSFINLASGSSLPVGQSRGPSTTTLESSTFSLDGQTVTLIDTPGFDDTTPSVLHVLKLISDHFAGLYRQGLKFAGVIYMHCATEDRMGVDPSRQNFQAFCKFCGDSSLRDILIVTHKGSADDRPSEHERGAARKDAFFRPAMDNGARMLSHDGSQASAHAIIRHLIDRETTGLPVQGRSPTRKVDCTLPTTPAGAVRQLIDHAKPLGELCQGIKETSTVTEDLRLGDENRWSKVDLSTQGAEVELMARLLGEERRTRELAEAEKSRAETREERVLPERRIIEKESLREYAGQKYGKLLTCGAVAFALVCVSRFLFDGSAL